MRYTTRPIDFKYFFYFVKLQHFDKLYHDEYYFDVRSNVFKVSL